MGSVSSVNSLLSSALTGSSAASNSGIDLSSILQAATGATSTGIDVTAAVTAALNAARAPERQWQAQQSNLVSQITALTTLQTALSSVSNDLNSLNDIGGPLVARSVSSSATQVTGTATAGASIGSHLIAVQSLATSASWYSPSLPSGSANLGTSTLTITSADGTQTSFNTGSGVNTLSDLAKAINSSGIGINASVVSDANGERLALVSQTTGSAADFAVSSSDPTFNMTRAGGPAANASLTVDGIPISSATNTVSGAITGLTLNLTGIIPANSPATVTVASDTTQISQALSSFVSDYNSALSQVNSQFTFSAANGSQGVLGSDNTVRSLQSALEGVVAYNSPASAGSGAIQSLGDLGITVNNDGSLSLDASKLTSAMANPEAVQNFFQGNALNGFAQQFSSELVQFNDPATGAITKEIQNQTQQFNALQSQVNDFESGYIASQQTVLTAMYSKAEIALQQLPAEMQQIQAELGNNSNSH
jgi:flagellar hook-associated protein 2